MNETARRRFRDRQRGGIQRESKEKDHRRSTLKAQKTCSKQKEKQRQVLTDRNIENRGREGKGEEKGREGRESVRAVPIGMADGLIKKKNETRVIRKLEEKW